MVHCCLDFLCGGAGVSGTADMRSASDTENTGTPESERANGVGGTAMATAMLPL